MKGTFYLLNRRLNIKQADGSTTQIPVASIALPYQFVLMYDFEGDNFYQFAGVDSRDMLDDENVSILKARGCFIAQPFDTEVFEQRELKGLIEFLKNPVVVVPRRDGSKPEKEKMRRFLTLVDNLVDDGSAVLV